MPVLRATAVLTGVDASVCRLDQDDRVSQARSLLDILASHFEGQPFTVKEGLIALEEAALNPQRVGRNLSEEQIRSVLRSSSRAKSKRGKNGNLWTINALE